jgi:copper chaperone CopZ
MRTLALAAAGLLLIAGCKESAQQADGPIKEAASEQIAATPAAFNVEGAPTVEFSVPDMMCEFSCAPKVQETLAAQPGVKDVQVDLEGKLATVAIDEEKFDADAAVAALVDVQFVNTKLASAPGEAAVSDQATPAADAEESSATPSSDERKAS